MLGPAVHLKRAAADYARLVPTHPMEAQEFRDGLDACKQLASDLAYDGNWPEDVVLPPRDPQVGDPEANGGLTRSEQLVSQDLAQFWTALPGHSHVAAMATAVHACQGALQSRVLRRLYPTYWMSTPGSLQQDAKVERERWKL